LARLPLPRTVAGGSRGNRLQGPDEQWLSVIERHGQSSTLQPRLHDHSMSTRLFPCETPAVLGWYNRHNGLRFSRVLVLRCSKYAYMMCTCGLFSFILLSAASCLCYDSSFYTLFVPCFLRQLSPHQTGKLTVTRLAYPCFSRRFVWSIASLRGSRTFLAVVRSRIQSRIFKPSFSLSLRQCTFVGLTTRLS
jgi:hypothetical protein